jgi:hypothetical protein
MKQVTITDDCHPGKWHNGIQVYLAECEMKHETHTDKYMIGVHVPGTPYGGMYDEGCTPGNEIYEEDGKYHMSMCQEFTLNGEQTKELLDKGRIHVIDKWKNIILSEYIITMKK